MANGECRPGSGGASADAADKSGTVDPEEFEFCVLSSGGGLALADMCFADEVFSGGKLLPLRVSSVTSEDASSGAVLIRSYSLDRATAASSSTSGFSSRSDSRSASSSSSSSCCVSRSTSQKSASSDSAARIQPSGTLQTPRRPLSSTLLYAHPSPSPRPSQSQRRGASSSARRGSTGSAPPASWGLFRLGVVGAPGLYPPRPSDSRRAAAARAGSRSARLEQPSAAANDAVRLDRKLAFGFLGGGLVCNCSPDAVEPVVSAEAAAAAARRRRMRKATDKNTRKVKSGQSAARNRRSRIVGLLEELTITKDKR